MKKFIAIILTLIMALSIIACSLSSDGDHIHTLQKPGSDSNGSSGQTDNGGGSGSPVQPGNGGDNISGDELSFVIAQGFEEREVVVRLTVPELQGILKPGTNHYVIVSFTNDYGLWITSDAISSVGYSNYARGFIDGDVIVVSTYITEEVVYDWDLLDELVVETSDGRLAISQGKVQIYNFQKSDIEVPLHEILPDMYSLHEFRVRPGAASLKATDNHDGTLTFTFNDTAVKPNYILPWEWYFIDQMPHIRYSCAIGGTLDARGDNVALNSRFSYERFLKFMNDSFWDYMTINMEDILMNRDPIGETYHPNGFMVTVDENGLTATWTEKFHPGFNTEDIYEFIVILSYDVSGDWDAGIYFTDQAAMWTNIYFDVERVMN